MNSNRTVLKAELEPLAGSLFQPTGFPDLGAAEFGTGQLLVESAQSMANWLEGTTWDVARNDQVAELSALPYVRVVSPEGAFLSSSRLEAHRLASATHTSRTSGVIDPPSAAIWCSTATSTCSSSATRKSRACNGISVARSNV